MRENGYLDRIELCLWVERAGDGRGWWGGGRSSMFSILQQCKLMFLILLTLCMLPFISVKLEHDVWCWNKNSVTVEILRGQPRPLEFIQTGYTLEYSVDHDITLVSIILC